ncbi:exported hypothetical protein [Syntrophobacter sp. SbD1]|nr:exported hypothetical protein [Syntrophobacter sp. SbD1]
MKVRGKLGVIMLALAFIFASAYIANAAIVGSADQPTVLGWNKEVYSDNHILKVVPVASWSEPGQPSASSHGAIRVDRDFGFDHEDDMNQFGDDRAYDSSGRDPDRETDRQEHQWTPETYGLMGDYGRDER